MSATFFEELDRLGWGSLHSDGPGHNDLYECLVTVAPVAQKLPQGAFPQ